MHESDGCVMGGHGPFPEMVCSRWHVFLRGESSEPCHVEWLCVLSLHRSSGLDRDPEEVVLCAGDFAVVVEIRVHHTRRKDLVVPEAFFEHCSRVGPAG